jgi:hypothetical protein
VSKQFRSRNCFKRNIPTFPTNLFATFKASGLTPGTGETEEGVEVLLRGSSSFFFEILNLIGFGSGLGSGRYVGLPAEKLGLVHLLETGPGLSARKDGLDVRDVSELFSMMIFLCCLCCLYCL